MTSAEITRRERKKIGGFEATFPNLVGMGGERERERDHGKEELPSDYASLWASSIQLFNVDGALKSRGKPAKTADPRPSMSVWWSTGQLRVVLNLSSDNTGKKKLSAESPDCEIPIGGDILTVLEDHIVNKSGFLKKNLS